MTASRSYFERLCQNGDRLFLGVLALLLALSFCLAPWYDTWQEALVIGLPAFAVPVWFVLTAPGARITRCTIAIALMVFTALHIHQSHGVIEAHFGVFVLLAFLLVYRDWLPLLVAASVIAVQHLAFAYAQGLGQPVWVFGPNAAIYMVFVHAAYVGFETGLLMWIAVRLRAETTAVGCDPRDLSRVAQELARGNVTVTVPSEGATPESLAAAMARMRDQLQGAVRDTGEVLHAIAAGDLSKRVTVEASGEFARLKDNVNQTAVFLASFTQRQQQLIQRANAGDFGDRVETSGLAGYQLELTQGLNELMGSVDTFVERLAEVLSALAHGDLTREITHSFSGNLEQLKRDTNVTAGQLAMIVDRIRASAEIIDHASKEIEHGNLELSSRTEVQADTLQRTSSATGELTDTVRKNAESAAMANELSQKASEVATRGGEVVSKVVSTMAGIERVLGQDRRHHRCDPGDRLPDQSAGTQRRSGSGARRRARARFRRGRLRSACARGSKRNRGT